MTCADRTAVTRGRLIVIRGVELLSVLTVGRIVQLCRPVRGTQGPTVSLSTSSSVDASREWTVGSDDDSMQCSSVGGASQSPAGGRPRPDGSGRNIPSTVRRLFHTDVSGA
jgi:hypothetical protein